MEWIIISMKIGDCGRVWMLLFEASEWDFTGCLDLGGRYVWREFPRIYGVLSDICAALPSKCFFRIGLI